MSVKQDIWQDAAYLQLPVHLNELDHAYGPGVHIIADPFLLGHLATLCDQATKQPAITHQIRLLYQHLACLVLSQEFPREVQSVHTRMTEFSARGIWTGQVLQKSTKAVTVNILRAGSVPSQICFELLNQTFEPEGIRQDHVVMARQADTTGHVTGSHLGDSKIGGPIDDAFVLFPDPMGATGSSVSEIISHYKNKVAGKARRYIAMNLIVTPQYLKKLKTDHPDLVIYALRLDRGASPEHVLKKRPGELWDEESGLTDKDYIIPGGGGFGEIMNNSYC